MQLRVGLQTKQMNIGAGKMKCNTRKEDIIPIHGPKVVHHCANTRDKVCLGNIIHWYEVLF